MHRQVAGGEGEAVKYTCCNYHCFDQCLLKVRVRDGVIVAIEPDDTINRGVARDGEHQAGKLSPIGMDQQRPCVRAYGMIAEIYHSDRVLHPMKRIGERGEAKFERISWHEALDTIAAKLVEVKQQFGPYSIFHGPYSMHNRCSFPLAKWFGAGVAGWAAHSCNGWEEPEKWVYGNDWDTRSRMLVQDELNPLKSRLIVLWGMNPALTHSSTFVHNLLQARERGIPIVSIEPRYTASAEVLADQWIPIRPTTDVAMMIAMANLWFKEDLCDHEFVEKWVEPEGLRRWQAYVLGAEDGVDKTPGWAEGICGVPKETIAEFARLYARSKPVNLNVSLSIGRQFYGENPARASMYLQALSGNMCLVGGTIPAQTGLMHRSGRGPWPRVSHKRAPATYEAPVLLAMYKWAKAVDLHEKMERGEISKANYNNAIGNASGKDCPNIQAVILESNNHLNNLPETNEVIRALKKVHFVLVFSQFADMPSARYADILLPQMHTAFEGRNGGFYTDLFSIGRNLIYRQKCVDAPGEVKSSLWVWTQVAKRLGIAQAFNPRLADVPDDRWDEATEALYQEAYEKWAKLDGIAELRPPSWQDFQKLPLFRFPGRTEPYVPFASDIERGRNPFDNTNSGKVEFFSEELAKGSDYLKANCVPQDGTRCYGGGALPPMAQMTIGGQDTFHSAEKARYPLLLSTPHAHARVHSFMDNNPLLRDLYRHAVWLSVVDAGVRNIADDDLVRVYNDKGEMVVPAYVTSRIVPGTVAVHHGGWYRPSGEKSASMPDGIDRGGAPNVLTHNRDLPETIVGFLPCKALVEVEKWGRG